MIAIGAFLAGLERVSPSTASTVSTIEPVVTLALAALLLGEVVTPARIGGEALILSAVILLTRSELQGAPVDASPGLDV